MTLINQSCGLCGVCRMLNGWKLFSERGSANKLKATRGSGEINVCSPGFHAACSFQPLPRIISLGRQKVSIQIEFVKSDGDYVGKADQTFSINAFTTREPHPGTFHSSQLYQFSTVVYIYDATSSKFSAPSQSGVCSTILA